MFQRYFTKPYRFIPPYRGRVWCHLCRGLVPAYLRRRMGVARWQFQGLDALRSSMDRRAGILLASNHCRWADAAVLGLLGLQLKQYFYYVVSHHLFKQRRAMGWLMNRVGGYSILREGSDRECLRTSARLLADADRPVVVFPEGTWFRQNDRLGPIQDGFCLILRHAARQANRPVVVHPVALKYWLLEDPRPILQSRLAAWERRLSWQAQGHLDLISRIEKLACSLLAVKEMEYLDAVQTEPLDERIRHLSDHVVTQLEKTCLGKVRVGWILERVRRLRQPLVRKLADGGDIDRVRAAQEALDVLLFCENLSAHSMDYLHERPSLERLTETVQRIEETVTDEMEIPVVPIGVTVAVGPALDVQSYPNLDRQGLDPLSAEVAKGIQALLDGLLGDGPPVGWGCPSGRDQSTVESCAAS